ncbi:hypothetical protein [Dorea sp.]|uniref:hypothetical protein n=1 Tax=Dorea sp. TaxID=2040332 RepID=UPI003528C055
MNTQEKIYEFRYSDLQNHKVYCVWKHANEDVWEICDDHLFNGSDALKMVETKIIREFDYEGKHYKVFVNPNDRFVKKEKFKSMGLINVVYIRFLEKDLVNLNIIAKKQEDNK